jgi:hypothetical protein
MLPPTPELMEYYQQRCDEFVRLEERLLDDEPSQARGPELRSSECTARALDMDQDASCHAPLPAFDSFIASSPPEDEPSTPSRRPPMQETVSGERRSALASSRTPRGASSPGKASTGNFRSDVGTPRIAHLNQLLNGAATSRPMQPPRDARLSFAAAVRTSLQLDEQMDKQRLHVFDIRNIFYAKNLDDLDRIKTKARLEEREATLALIEREEQKVNELFRRQVDVDTQIKEQAPLLSRDVTDHNSAFAESWLAYLEWCKHRQTQRFNALKVQVADLEHYQSLGEGVAAHTSVKLTAAKRKQNATQEALRVHRIIRELSNTIAEVESQRKRAMAAHAKVERYQQDFNKQLSQAKG